MSSKTDLVKEALKDNPDPSPEEIAQMAADIGCSKSLVYKWLRKMPKPTEVVTPTPVEPVVTVEEEGIVEVPVIEEAEVPIIEEEAVVEVPSERVEGLAERLEAGMLTSEDITYVWSSVNQLFPQKYQRPDKAMQILGKLWVKPANRMIEKYAVENVDLYLAVGVTVLTFAPSLVGMVRDRRKKPKESEESELQE